MVGICCIIVSFAEMLTGLWLTNKQYPEFRYKGQVSKIFIGILVGLIGIVYVWNSWLFYISTTLNIIVSIVFSAMYSVFWHSKFWNVMLLQLFYYTNISILKLPLLTIIGIQSHANMIQVNNGQRSLAEVIYAAIILILLHLIVKKNKNVEVAIQELFEKNIRICSFIVILEWLLLCVCIRTGGYEFESTDLILDLLFIMCIVLLLICVTLFGIYRNMKIENLFQQEIYRCLKSQYYEIEELYEMNSRWLHDVKHELLFIQCCLEEKDISAAQKSIQDYMNVVVKTEKKVWSSFPFLDFILNYKISEANKSEIQFRLDIDLQYITIIEEDLVIIIGNLLDNAIEAAEKCVKGKRYIEMKIHNANHMMILNIENSNSEPPKLSDGIFISGKKDKKIHGWGIGNVEHIVEKYDGEMELQYSKEFFRVEIII